jgi:Asp-tRNA(Asn)/Glu-tRNA(Gln) amidotransferase B subunit
VKLADLLRLIHQEKISVANGKVIMLCIIDGDEDTPTQIADKLGLIGDEISLQDVQDVIDQVLEEKKTIV